jgi:transcriptional regulator with XRE-family HTH domain
MDDRTKFGSTVRKAREQEAIGLRTMAKLLDVSPTYLSKVERGKEPPPREDRIQKISEILNLDADLLLAEARRVPDELLELYCENPAEVMALLRQNSNLRSQSMVPISHLTKREEG